MATRLNDHCGEMSPPSTPPTVCHERATHRVSQWNDYHAAQSARPGFYLVGYFCREHADAKKDGLDRHHAEMLDLERRGDWHGHEPYRPSSLRHAVVVVDAQERKPS